jgi:hypothetical protein
LRLSGGLGGENDGLPNAALSGEGEMDPATPDADVSIAERRQPE